MTSGTLEYLGLLENDGWTVPTSVFSQDSETITFSRLATLEIDAQMDWQNLSFFDSAPLQNLHLERTAPSITDPDQTDQQTLLAFVKAHSASLKFVTVWGVSLEDSEWGYESDGDWEIVEEYCEKEGIEWDFDVSRWWSF